MEEENSCPNLILGSKISEKGSKANKVKDKQKGSKVGQSNQKSKLNEKQQEIRAEIEKRFNQNNKQKRFSKNKKKRSKNHLSKNKLNIAKRLRTVSIPSSLTQRASKSKSIHPNLPDPNQLYKELKEQIEYYLGDNNLSKDKFLLKTTQNHLKGYIDVEILKKFRRVLDILFKYKITDPRDITPSLQTAIDQSDLLRLNKSRLYFCRKVRFSLDDFNSKERVQWRDERSIFVEGLPEDGDGVLNYLASSFSPFGKILHISIPRRKGGLKSQIQGYAFILFLEKKSVKNAMNFSKTRASLHTLMGKKTKKDRSRGGRNSSQGLIPSLNVMTKIEWLDWKTKFKNLRKQVLSSSKGENQNSLETGTLLRIKITQIQESQFSEQKSSLSQNQSSSKGSLCLNKHDIKNAIAKFVMPAYVDFDQNQTNLVVRFHNNLDREEFLSQLSEQFLTINDAYHLNFSRFGHQDEISYFQKIEKKRIRYRTKKQKKIQKRKVEENETNKKLKND